MTPPELHDHLGACSVRITTAGNHRGTGFFVAPGKLLTAAHVVAPSILANQAFSIIWQKGHSRR
jgi:hypothetical protein